MESAEELWDENENADSYPLKKEFYAETSSGIKRFLSDYYGDKLLNLEPETYTDIETILKEDIDFYNCNLVDVLSIHSTIKDSDEYYKAFDNFVPDNRTIHWPVLENWFDRDFKELENEDAFLEGVNDFDLTEDQRKAKEIVEIADKMLNDAQSFNHFVRSGYNRINREVHLFMEEHVLFDLSILTDDGFNELQKQIDIMITSVLEDLYSLE